MTPTDDDSNVTRLPVRAKPRSDAALTVVQRHGGCQHRRTAIDERLAEVTCRDCGEKLNPLFVLAQLAREDSHLRNTWTDLRVEINLLRQRSRVTCQHCRKVTPVRIDVSHHQRLVMREQLQREDAARGDDA